MEHNQECCKICKAVSEFIFEGVMLNKYKVKYFKCEYCGFIQTEDPYWLEEAYSDAIKSIDVGYVQRNLLLSNYCPRILEKVFNSNGKFLDYGGGYGLFVRLMRDKGYNFYRYDKYCQNIFATYFDADNVEEQIFEMMTCFEVFEHLSEPLFEIKNMLKYSNSILFSTELQPEIKLTSTNDWWYFAPEGGQHIAFYTVFSLKLVADKFGLKLYHLKDNLHLLTNRIIDVSVFNDNKQSFLQRIYRRFIHCAEEKTRISLIEKDFIYAKSMIIDNNGESAN